MGDRKMSAQASELQAAENNLKQLMAEVSRAMEKAQEAIAKIALKTESATAPAESTKSPCGDSAPGQGPPPAGQR
jgi:septal ring factor EnvC (AmiA/AmiB activator)